MVLELFPNIAQAAEGIFTNWGLCFKPAVQKKSFFN